MHKNPITIEVLETLDAIDRRGSYAKAAEELNKATSAVSYAVQKLEEQLDIALFQRLGRRSVLTPAGRLVLAEGREIIATTKKLAQQAKEIATGWEPRINIALDALQNYPALFVSFEQFLQQYPSVEIDICESVLNGGWEALDQGRVDLLIGAPGPAPAHKGYRVVAMPTLELVPVIAAKHALVQAQPDCIYDPKRLAKLRGIVTHDSSFTQIKRSEGLTFAGQVLFVQNTDQKLQAILAGIGIGHLPKHRIQGYLEKGQLLRLDVVSKPPPDCYMAWKISNKGKGLHALTTLLQNQCD